MENKAGHLTFETDNLAVPEVHTHEERIDIAENEAEAKENKVEKESILFDNVAIPEIHIKK